MNQTDDRRDNPLPVTAEIGSEGGSYADPTSQAATFGDEDEPRTIKEPQSDVVDAADFASIRAGGVGAAPDPHDGMIRYPTEPPAPPAATGGSKAQPRWQSAAVGAAAGFAGAALVAFLRNRRSLLVPERDERIDPGRAPGGDVTGGERHDSEQ